jgi:uncharacterized protein (TIGR02266 family)
MSAKRSGSKERRGSERQALEIPVDYSSVDSFFSEMATNINEGGMFLATDESAEIDQLVKLAFQLPGLSRPIEVEARVAWLSRGEGGAQPGIGLQFLALSDEVRDTINRLVRTLRTSG